MVEQAPVHAVDPAALGDEAIVENLGLGIEMAYKILNLCRERVVLAFSEEN